MPERKERQVIPVKGGFVDGLAMRVKLVARLIADPRVHPLLKVLPLGTLLYLIFPDFVPGPVDDAALVWLGGYLFVELCPPEVVQEHMAAMEKVIPGGWRDAADDEDVVDAEYWEETR